MSEKAVKPVSRKSDLVTQELGKEILIYDLLIDKVFNLNETSALTWELCNGKNSVAEIAAGLSERFGAAVDENFVFLALDQLKKNNLLENAGEISIDFGALSRREAIRKIGFATLVALPLVTSLIAPPAARAQSCSTGAANRALGCPCTTVGQCRPPSGRCCLSSVGAANNQTCVQSNTEVADGGRCGNACSCISNCCAAGVCVAFQALPANSRCTINCQCSSGTCGAGNLCT